MKLLLVEDEKVLSKVLVTVLEKNNYVVEPVFDGLAALEHLGAEIYDGPY